MGDPYSGARFNFAGGDLKDEKYAPGISDMDVVNRERTTADPFAPTAAGDPAKFDTLIYPLDLNPENFFPEAICFQVKKRIGLTIDETIARAKPHMGQMINEISSTADIVMSGGDYKKRVDREMALQEGSYNPAAEEKLRQEAEARLAQEGVSKGTDLTYLEGLEEMGSSVTTNVTKMFGAWDTAIAGQKKMTP